MPLIEKLLLEGSIFFTSMIVGGRVNNLKSDVEHYFCLMV